MCVIAHENVCECVCKERGTAAEKVALNLGHQGEREGEAERYSVREREKNKSKPKIFLTTTRTTVNFPPVQFSGYSRDGFPDKADAQGLKKGSLYIYIK